MGLAVAVLGLPFLVTGCRLLATHLEEPAPSRCADCHREIVAQWERSAHAAAWTDPRFVALTDGRRNEACLPCHAPAPLLEQPPTAPVQLRPSHRESGVDCHACHSVACAYAGPYRSWGPHPVKKDKTRLPCASFCGTCHAGEYDEYISLYTPLAEASGAPQQCATCHMPATISRLTQDHLLSYAHPKRIVHDHSFHALGERPAAGVVEIGDLAMGRRADGEVEVSFTLTNRGAGHRIPTGRFGQRGLRILVAVLGTDGLTLGRREQSLLSGAPGALAPGQATPFSVVIGTPRGSQPANVRVSVERPSRDGSSRYPLATGAIALPAAKSDNDR
jgi:hypothetical protein